MVEKGLLEVNKKIRDSNEIFKCGPGDSFGEQYLMLKSKKNMRAQCIQDSTVWTFNRQTFR